MSKELFVSSTPHETKVAVVEDDQLTEIYYERENEYTLAGSIYKGRVTRVLPGMQSAFVDIGLERDAFLYVSDFFEDQEEYDAVVSAAETNVLKLQNGAPNGTEIQPVKQFKLKADRDAESAGVPPEEGDSASADADSGEGARRWRGRRRRRGGRGRGGFRERDIARDASQQTRPEGAAEATPEDDELEIQDAGAETMEGDEQPMEAAAETFEDAQPAAAAEARDEQPREQQPQQREQRDDRGPRRDFRDRENRRGGRDRGFGRDRDRGRDRNADREPSRPAYPPIILPGESISKYRHLSQQENKPIEAAETLPPVEPVESAPAAGYEISGGYQEEPVERKPETAIATAPQEAERFEQMNVASVFAGDEGFRGSNVEQPGEPPQSKTELSRFGSGLVEQEEIEEEDVEAASFNPLEDEEFDDLEEETLESEDNPIAQATEAVREEHVEERATGHYEAEGAGDVRAAAAHTDDETVSSVLDEEEFDEDDVESAEMSDEDEGEDEMEGDEEFAEAEMEAGSADDAGDAAEAGDDNVGNRAEVRASSGTARFQRSSRRGGRFDRRRGGGGGRRPMRRGGRRNIQSSGRPQINELLKEGQEILIQIAKEPIAKKGARITSHIALPGRFLVYMPTVDHIGVSRKIGSDEERQRLKRILLSEREGSHGGFIVRTAAAGASEDDLRADIRFLINLWTEIKGRAESSKAPALIYHDLNVVERILRDQVTQTYSHIWVDTEPEYERILKFVSRFQPSLVKRVKLYTKDTPLFEQFSIQDEINKALKSKVWLKSGGYIVINQTEALVAIDINTGKFVGKTSRLEDTIVKVNIDAIQEIVRQIRLRDLGGIIVIDFIDMDERRNRQKVMQALEEALKSDRAPSKVLQFNDFGLVAITRKRVKQSLERTLGQQCNYCTGTGLIKSPATVCNEIYVEMRKIYKHLEHRGDITLRVNPEVGKALKSNGARLLTEMEDLTGRTVIVKADPLLHQEQFDIQ